MKKLFATVVVSLVTGAAFVAVGAPATAYADDFMAVCKAGTPVPEADKLCKCTSDNVAAADRAAAIAAMTAVNAAMTKGTVLDPTSLPADLAKGMAAVMEAQMKCM